MNARAIEGETGYLVTNTGDVLSPNKGGALVPLSKIEAPRNVLQRLNDARSKFHNLQLRKSGHNKHMNYRYFELGDFLIPALGIFNEVGLCPLPISFTADEAVMTIANVDDPSETISFRSPMGSAALKGCHEVQNIGAVETYQRRYLWVAALEIVEHDALDASEGAAPHEVEAAAIEPISDQQWARIVALCQATRTNGDEVKKHIGAKNLKRLAPEQYTAAIDYLEDKLAVAAKAETDAKMKETADA